MQRSGFDPAPYQDSAGIQVSRWERSGGKMSNPTERTARVAEPKAPSNGVETELGRVPREAKGRIRSSHSGVASLRGCCGCERIGR